MRYHGGQGERSMRLFTEHPASVGESYFEHMVSAMGFSWRLFYAALMCLIHAFLPFLFLKGASVQVGILHGRMIDNRSKIKPATGEAQVGPQSFQA